jgi:hypothetical protein
MTEAASREMLDQVFAAAQDGRDLNASLDAALAPFSKSHETPIDTIRRLLTLVRGAEVADLPGEETGIEDQIADQIASRMGEIEGTSAVDRSGRLRLRTLTLAVERLSRSLAALRRKK